MISPITPRNSIKIQSKLLKTIEIMGKSMINGNFQQQIPWKTPSETCGPHPKSKPKSKPKTPQPRGVRTPKPTAKALVSVCCVDRDSWGGSIAEWNGTPKWMLNGFCWWEKTNWWMGLQHPFWWTRWWLIWIGDWGVSWEYSKSWMV